MSLRDLLYAPLRAVASALAEVSSLLGNASPRFFAVPLWRAALALDRHHEVAALNLARALLHQRRTNAWQAFETVLEQLHNPWNTSASDLHLRRLPGRLARRGTARWLHGRLAGDPDAAYDQARRKTLRNLTTGHVQWQLEEGDLPRARRALGVLADLLGPETLDVAFPEAELLWRDGQQHEALTRLEPHFDRGAFPAPEDVLTWSRRALEVDEAQTAGTILGHARHFLPTETQTWHLLGQWHRLEGRQEEAAETLRRALHLDPQNLEVWLDLHPDHRESPSGITLELHAPEVLALGASTPVSARLHGAGTGWHLLFLPPRGRGLWPEAVEHAADAEGSAQTTLTAHRPHRVHGGPWPLMVLGLGPEGHAVARTTVVVMDTKPGRCLLTVTEDHEIHEERGVFSTNYFERQLVEKSRFTSEGRLWTHMVELGSTLEMTAEAARLDPAWQPVAAAVRDHLAEEVARGNDLQPHLHTFNDPAYGHFPYQLDSEGWRPSRAFLATAAHQRGDWASVCPPPGQEGGPSPGFDRLESVERAVAQLEAVGRLGSPDYRPLLWRSGLLEYGDTPADRSWSAVALEHAGLAADSDLPKPSSPGARAIPAAFPASRAKPFEPQPGGPLLQLPIVANLEGDYRMGPAQLARRARACRAAVDDGHSGTAPGVHLFTVLTHDKFLNARREREEYRLDRDYGDWRTIDHHLEAWRAAGVEEVTASVGVAAVWDDLAWHPWPVWRGETFVLPEHGPPELTYNLEPLGSTFPASTELPHELTVRIPCFLRHRLLSLQLEDGKRRRTIQPEAGGLFWLRWSGGPLPRIRVRTTDDLAITREPLPGGLRLRAKAPFLAARVFLPGFSGELRSTSSHTPEGSPTDDGLLLEGLQFPRAASGEVLPLDFNTTEATE